MKILFTSSGGTGHVLPMLGLALAARRQGHAIAWATARSAWPWLAVHGIETFEAGASPALCGAEYRARHPVVPAGRAHGAHAFPNLFGHIVASGMVVGLDDAIVHWQPTLIVNELGALAAPLVARRRGVPHISHAFGLPMPAATLQAAAQAAAPLWNAAGLALPPFAGLYDHLAIEIAPPSLQAVCPYPVLAPRFVRQRPTSVTGALNGRLPPGLDRFLSAHDARPLVYVTFGTVFDRAPALEPLLAALRSFRDARFVLTGAAPATGPLVAEHVWHGTYASQQMVLPHCDAVVSHAGSGTCFEALAQGLPQLCLPQGADQFRNADAVAALGAGLLLDTPTLSADAVRASLHSLLTQPALRDAAKRMAAEIGAMAAPQDMLALMEKLV